MCIISFLNFIGYWYQTDFIPFLFSLFVSFNRGGYSIFHFLILKYINENRFLEGRGRVEFKTLTGVFFVFNFSSISFRLPFCTHLFNFLACSIQIGIWWIYKENQHLSLQFTISILSNKSSCWTFMAITISFVYTDYQFRSLMALD